MDVNVFWSALVKPNGADGCWEWRGSHIPTGYGRVQFNKKQVYTHRLAYELVNGPIPDGLHVLHYCDNPSCCNPSHLWLGTVADNMADRDAKGHGMRGKKVKHRRVVYVDPEKLSNVKINWIVVRQMRAMWATGKYSKRELARTFGIADVTVRNIIANRRWREPLYSPFDM